MLRLCVGVGLLQVSDDCREAAQGLVTGNACVSHMTDQTMLNLHDTRVTVTRPHMSMCIAAPSRLCVFPYDRACIHINLHTTTQHK